MKQVKVVAAVIQRGNQILATQRGYGPLKGGWEFPGGKIEANETAQQALIREINEELGVQIEIGSFFDHVSYDYPDFHLEMDVYMAQIKEGQPELRVHSQLAWVTADQLEQLAWLEADLGLIEKLKESLAHA